MPTTTTMKAPAAAASPPVNFVFMDPFNKPSAGKSEKIKREVRSHVTSRQHLHRKEQVKLAREELKAKRKVASEMLQARERELAGRVNGLVESGGEVTGEDQDEEMEGPVYNRDEEMAVETKTHQAAGNEQEDEEYDQLLPIISPSADLSNPSIAAFRRGTLAFQLFVLNDPSNDIGKILQDLHIDALSVVNNYQADALRNAKLWEHQFQPLTNPGTAQQYLPNSIFRDPALTASAVLLGLSLFHHHSFPSLPFQSKPPPGSPPARIHGGILRLRGHVLRSINLALDDIERATSDELITAVLLLATSEALCGLRESYPTHMRGLMGMINVRGGLRELGFRGCMEALVLWQDANIAQIAGSAETFGHLAWNPSPVLVERQLIGNA